MPNYPSPRVFSVRCVGIVVGGGHVAFAHGSSRGCGCYKKYTQAAGVWSFFDFRNDDVASRVLLLLIDSN